MCPLCFAEHLHQLAVIDAKTYWRCKTCHLTFLSSADHLSPADELARYLLHENNPDDPRYRKFLSRLTDDLGPKLAPGAEGLDYGSGPGPTLSVMLKAQGFSMNIYDPYFAPYTDVLERTYDFITCTETVEHFYHPAKEFQQFDRLLQCGGWLGVMTEMLESDEEFSDWWYHREPTHVCFYKRETMAWIAETYSWEVAYPRKNVTLFYKPENLQEIIAHDKSE
ncbi:MAG: class I SAM-dependent methyltransferase [Candidatus Poribacteria bacterium]|nr:class I SAM-dependent methyltransferase [Candidatus Poribacteria bacterium]